MRKVHRITPGVYLLLQARATDVLAELYSGAQHDRTPVMFACSAAESAADVFTVNDGSGLVVGTLHVVMPEADANALHEWVRDRVPAEMTR
ncbi:hypothetical protein KFS85_19880 [Xanthomonas graminis pv. phlei]|nr:hypothetical protein [Xanthomonas translucens]UKE75352.1 hypothetical protein KFS85_19880 [Xanthomonas translucens pv. phleipratensis]